MKFGLIAIGVLAAASLLAQFGAPPARRPQGAARQPARQAAALQSLVTYLNLSDQQVQQLKDLNAQHRIATHALSTQFRSNQMEIHRLMNSSTETDAAQAGQLVVQSRKLKAQLDASRQELAQKAAVILTPDQQQKLATLSSTVQSQREASPGLMPESWPMLRAAAQLGLIAPPAHGDGQAAPAEIPRAPAPPPAQN